MGRILDAINGIVLLGRLISSLYFGCSGLTTIELNQEKEKIDKMVIDATDTISLIGVDSLNFRNQSAIEIYRQEKAPLPCRISGVLTLQTRISPLAVSR